MNSLTHPLDDLIAARDEEREKLFRNSKPRLPEEDAPPHWLRHLYDAEGRLV